MVKDKLEEIMKEIEPMLLTSGFARRGSTNGFIRKNKDDYRREEHLDFSARQHRNDTEAIYISCTVGLYYPMVKKVYKSIIEDHLSKYPIIAGSISHFSSRQNYLSVCYKRGVNKDEVVTEIGNEIINGAFHLAETFPNLKSIYEGFKNQHPFLYNFYGKNVQTSNSIEIASIIYLLEGKDSALNWLQQNLERQPATESIFENVEKLK